MTDDRKCSRKPVSLNDRHYRLLQDLSSAPPKPRPSSIPDEEEREGEVERRRHLYKLSTRENHGVGISAPPFFGIADFNSPREEAEVGEEESFKVKLEGRRLSLKSSTRVNDGDGVDSSYQDISAPHFSGMADFESAQDTLKEEKLTKVKMEGRRRLCKFSSQGHEDTENGGLVEDGCGYANISDFDSPGLSRFNPGVSDIRDILNDLSSKLGLLSIEKKKRFPEGTDKVEDNYLNESKVVQPEYEIAVSKFSHLSDPSDSLSDVANNVEEYTEEGHLQCDSDVLETGISIGDGKKDEFLRVDKLASMGKSIVYSVEVEGESDLILESGGRKFAVRAQNAKKNCNRVKKEEPKMVPERLRYAGGYFASNLRDEEEEDDDCQVFSGKQIVKESMGNGRKYKESFDHSSVVDLLDDCEEESVLAEKDSFSLAGPVSTFKLPSKVAKILYPHQHEGLRWLWSLHCQGKGGVLGDDMGLGKTMQICGFLAGLFHTRLIKRALVVAPKTLLSLWIKELSIVGLSGMTREYFGTSTKTREYELQYILQDKGVLLTTYDIVRNNFKALQGDHYFVLENDDVVTWDYMILDEGHLIKNPSTQRAKSLLQIPSAHRIVVSGTPIQNNLKELWALFNFCCPGLLGDNKWFKEKYEHAILRGNEKNASDRDKRIGSAVAKELRECIQPYFLRRLKNEVFKEGDTKDSKLSKKNEIIVWLRLTNCQRQLYESFLQSELVLSVFDGSPLAALTTLKKICDHPLLLTKRAAEDVLEGMDSMLNQEDACLAEKLVMHIADAAERDAFEENHDIVSCKISFILVLLDNLVPQGHSILIFSQTRKMLNLIEGSLVSSGYKFLRIDGTTKTSDRMKIVNDFQEGCGAPIFLLTSQVGGLGLTLTRADRVIVVDPAWNPSTDNQSVDRAYRIGQKKDVLVYRLMTCGTVEEKIYRKQIFKGGLFKSATEHKEQIRYFSQQDLRELFSLPKQGFDISVTQQQLHEEHDSQHEVDESLGMHLKFLETQGIAGVSHHSLLFSKTAPVQAVTQEEEEEIRRKHISFVGKAFSTSSIEPNVDGARQAFNPKDVILNRKSPSPDKVGKQTESEINDRINRLSQILANKVTVSRLPDGGAKLQKQIADLSSELNKIMMEKRIEKEVIDLDDLTGELDGVLNV